MKYQTILTTFRGGFLITLSLLICQFSTAQDNADEQQVFELEEFVVSGQRATNRNSIDDRKNNDSLVDSVGSDELGGLPDRNLGEALGRLAGVTTVEDEGVGRYATVRGLKSEYVNVTLDGGGFSSAARPWDADSGRATNLQAISPDIISKVQVFKTITPDLDGNSIGGTINLVTRSAYDAGPLHYSLGMAFGDISSGSVQTLDPETSYKVKGIVSAILGDKKQFGIVLNASERKIDRIILKEDILSGWGDPSVPAYPTGNWDAITGEVSVKKGGFAKFEFRPNHKLYAFFSINYFEEAEDWKKREHILWNSGSYDNSTSSFSGFAGLVQPRHTLFGTDDAITYSFGLDWNSENGGVLSLMANSSSSEFYHHDVRAQWIASWGGLDGTYTADGRNWDLILDSDSAAIFTDPEQYYFNEHRNKKSLNVKEVESAKIDWGKNVHSGDHGWGYKVGAKVTSHSLSFTQAYFRGDKASKTGFDVYKYSDSLTLTDFTGALGLPYILGSASGIEEDIESVGLESYKSNFARWKSNYNNAQDYMASEDVVATYAMGRFGTERTSTVFGVRYEGTSWNGEARLNSEEDGELVKTSGDYDHFLPSVGVSHRLNNDWSLRASYNMAVGRPEAKDLIPRETTPDFDEQAGTWKVYRSNPNLEAREANNYDLAVEYYFDEGNSIFTAGVFYKDIKNEIYDLTRTQPITFEDPETGDPITVDARVTQPTNAGDASVLGFETAIIVDSLKFLPEPFNGIGFQANFTYLNGEMDLLDADGEVFRQLDKLHHQAKQAINFILFYEHEKFSLRLAAKHYTDMIYSLNFDPLQDLNQDDLTRFDFHAEYRINKNIEVFLDVANLTKEDTFYYGGPWDESVNYGRTVWLGMNIRN